MKPASDTKDESQKSHTEIVSLKPHNPTKEFFKIDNKITDHFVPLIGLNGVGLYNIYVRLQNEQKGYAWPSLEKLEESTGTSKRTIIRLNKKLEKYGLIIKIKGSLGKSNKYYIRPPVVNQEDLQKAGNKPLIATKLKIDSAKNNTHIVTKTTLTECQKRHSHSDKNDTLKKQTLKKQKEKKQTTNKQKEKQVPKKTNKEEIVNKNVVKFFQLNSELINKTKVDNESISKWIVEKGNAFVLEKLQVVLTTKNVRNPNNLFNKACVENWTPNKKKLETYAQKDKAYEIEESKKRIKSLKSFINHIKSNIVLTGSIEHCNYLETIQNTLIGNLDILKDNTPETEKAREILVSIIKKLQEEETPLPEMLRLIETSIIKT